MKKVYQLIAAAFVARGNCEKSGNAEWFNRHEETIEAVVKKYLPSGSGFDSGTRFDFNRSRADLLIFTTAFHPHGPAGRLRRLERSYHRQGAADI